MVAAAADVQITATIDAATLRSTSMLTTTALENELAPVTAATASGTQAASSYLNYFNNNNIYNNTDNSSNNNMSNATAVDAAKKTAAETPAVEVTTTRTSAAPDTTTAALPSKSAVSQRNVDIKIGRTSNVEVATQQLNKKVLQLDLGAKNLDEYSLKSPKSPIAARLPHQSSLTSSVDVEDRKTLREALYQGIFHRHRRTIFAVGSFLRMLRSRNSQYNTIRSSSEGEDIDEVR